MGKLRIAGLSALLVVGLGLPFLTGSTNATTRSTRAPELYVFTGMTLGVLYAWPHFPKLIYLDNHDQLAALRWKRPRLADATATGTLIFDLCQPSCAGGQLARYPVQLTAERPVTCVVKLRNPSTGAFRHERADIYYDLSSRVGGKAPSGMETYLVRVFNAEHSGCIRN